MAAASAADPQATRIAVSINIYCGVGGRGAGTSWRLFSMPRMRGLSSGGCPFTRIRGSL